MPTIKDSLKNLSSEERYFFIYEMAKEQGEKFPELIAAQFALETASGTKLKYPESNNIFNQTQLENNGKPAFKVKGVQYYFKDYETLDEAVSDRIKKWSHKYKNENNPISAMAKIQPSFAPNNHGNQKYMSSIAGILKKQGYYKGETNIPNADANPEFYQNIEYNSGTQKIDFTKEYKDKAYKEYISKRNEIRKEPNEKLRNIKLNKLHQEEYLKGHIKDPNEFGDRGFLNEYLKEDDKKNAEARNKKLIQDKRKNKAKYGEREEAFKVTDKTSLKEQERFGIVKTKIENKVDVESDMIDINPLWKKPEVIIEEIPENNDKGNDNNKTTTEKTTEETQVAEPTNFADEFFNRELDLNSVDGNQVNYEPGKKEINVDAIMGLALGIIGNDQAKNAKIPLRTEEVDQAMKSYIAEIKERSEQGLPVEIEAAMKSQLADAYQGGLENIVNASAGNRATVLGNLGSLEAAKNKGLMDISIADYEAKDRAFAQYGKALEYVNDFNARRDIANHGIEYAEAKEKQQEGKQLADAGFGKLMDAIKYQKENGPGSANDMYRSMLMQSMFGFDPKMPDDGTGSKVGTKSYYDKMKLNKQVRVADTEKLQARYQALNKDAKGAFNKVMEQNQDYNVLSGYLDYLEGNTDKDFSKVNAKELGTALEKNDFSLLEQNPFDMLKQATNSATKTIEDVNKNPLGTDIPDLSTNPFNPNPQNAVRTIPNGQSIEAEIPSVFPDVEEDKSFGKLPQDINAFDYIA